MYHIKTKPHYIDIIFILALFFLFAFSSSSLIILGSNIYRNTISQMNEHFDTRTASSYLTEKIHQNDSENSVSITTIEQQSVLKLTQEMNDISYTTYLYTYDGYLYELFTRSELDFAFEYGQKILPLSSVSFDWYTDQLLQITMISEDNNTENIFVSLISRQTN